MHAPFVDRSVFNWILKLVSGISKRNASFSIVQLGDLYDLYSFSKFAQRHRLTARDELRHGREQAEEIFRLLNRAAPNARVYLIRGNHDARLVARIAENFGSALDDILERGVRALWEFPGVETIHDTKTVLELQGIKFTHGHLSKIGAHSEAMDLSNVVCGHSHTGGVVFRRHNSGRISWELNAGYVANPFDPELNYRPLTKYFKWTHGIGFIDAHGPRFIPYPGGDSGK